MYGWPGGASAQSGEGFEPEVELVSPEGSGSPGKGAGNGSGLSRSDVTGGSVGADGTGPDGIGAGEAGGGLFGGGRAGADEAKSGGFWSWVADRGLGLVKGIGAGLIGAAVVGLGAVLIGVSAPVLAAVAGAAVLGGAVYGLFVGGRDFNWLEGIVGSVIGGVSAGVGGWLTAAGSAIAAKVGVAATNVVAGGLTSLSSYLIHSPDRSWGGALGALVLCCSKERRMTLSRKITQADRDKFELFLFEMDDVLEPFLSNAQQAGYRLDYTLDSLPVLEAYWLAASGVAEDLETMAQRAARYYGEVFRKSYGGQWRLSDENPKSMYYGFPVLYGFNPAAPGFEFCPLFVIRNFTIRKVPGSLLKAVEAAVPKQ